MTCVRRHRLLCLALLGFAFTLSGCAQSATAERKYYVLDVTRAGPLAKVHTDATLRLRRFNADEAFASRQLVYRLDEFRYEPDYYHQLLILPGVMTTEETRDWLADSGLFDRVTGGAGALLNAAQQLVLLPFGELKIVIGERGPLLFQLALGDGPVAFDFECVHIVLFLFVVQLSTHSAQILPNKSKTTKMVRSKPSPPLG